MMIEERERLLERLLELRREARKIYNRELAAFDEDRIVGGDPAAYASAEDRVLREMRTEILKLLGIR
jgi:hypothetical protein